MKEKLRLVTVLELKDDLEKRIASTYASIIEVNNTGLSSDELLKALDKLEEQLIIIKEAIQHANKGRYRSIHTNNYYIYKHSNLLARKRLYSKISRSDTDKPISYDAARIKIKEIYKELENVRNKLSNFNLRKKVTVDIDVSLNLLKK